MPAEAYRFYQASRRCPECRAVLLTTTPITLRFTRGVLHDLGIACYCVRCNSRYRARSWLPFTWVAWAGPVGRWLWWQTTSLHRTL